MSRTTDIPHQKHTARNFAKYPGMRKASWIYWSHVFYDNSVTRVLFSTATFLSSLWLNSYTKQIVAIVARYNPINPSYSFLILNTRTMILYEVSEIGISASAFKYIFPENCRIFISWFFEVIVFMKKIMKKHFFQTFFQAQ